MLYFIRTSCHKYSKNRGDYIGGYRKRGKRKRGEATQSAVKEKIVRNVKRFCPCVVLLTKAGLCFSEAAALRGEINYVAAKATYIRLLYGQKRGFSALAP